MGRSRRGYGRLYQYPGSKNERELGVTITSEVLFIEVNEERSTTPNSAKIIIIIRIDPKT